jgi:hypothetical protein
VSGIAEERRTKSDHRHERCIGFVGQPRSGAVSSDPSSTKSKEQPPCPPPRPNRRSCSSRRRRTSSRRRRVSDSYASRSCRRASTRRCWRRSHSPETQAGEAVTRTRRATLGHAGQSTLTPDPTASRRPPSAKWVRAAGSRSKGWGAAESSYISPALTAVWAHQLVSCAVKNLAAGRRESVGSASSATPLDGISRRRPGRGNLLLWRELFARGRHQSA